MPFYQVLKSIKQNDTFLITTHVNPDPDALCSQLALALYLKKQGKRVHLINDGPVPERFKFLPHSRNIKSAGEISSVSYDVSLVVDCGDRDRIGKVRDLLIPEKMLINIDHHVTNTLFGDLNLVDAKASSTSEVIFRLLRQAKFPLNRDAAVLLYLGIMTDTGSFRYDNTSAQTHRIVSKLMEFDFSVNELYQKMYEAVPFEEYRLFTKVVDSFDLLYGGKVVCVELPKRVTKEFSEEFDLRDKIFKSLRAIKKVEVLVILTEVKKNCTRVNLRSQTKVDVSRLAAHFQGGGHKKASGCVVNKNLKDTRRVFLKMIKDVL